MALREVCPIQWIAIGHLDLTSRPGIEANEYSDGLERHGTQPRGTAVPSSPREADIFYARASIQT